MEEGITIVDTVSTPTGPTPPGPTPIGDEAAHHSLADEDDDFPGDRLAPRLVGRVELS